MNEASSKELLNSLIGTNHYSILRDIMEEEKTELTHQVHHQEECEAPTIEQKSHNRLSSIDSRLKFLDISRMNTF